MRILYVPDEPSKYLIRWKRSTEATFPPENEIVVTKSSDLQQTVDLNVADANTDWDVEICAVCDGKKGVFKGIRVKGACQAVTYEVAHCLCPTVGDMNLQST